MKPRTTSPALDDVDFLARAGHRVAVLTALSERPRSRIDLRELTGVSQSTIGRTLREFEDRHWIVRDGGQYETTQLGAFVAEGVQELLDRFEAERTLRAVWRLLPDESSGFAVEMAADAVVTVADAEAPYRPVNRFASLLRETDRFRFVGRVVALLEPCRDELRERILDGMDAEIVDSPEDARYVLSNYREHCAAPLQRDNFTVRVHDDVPPYGVALFDDRIAVGCYDRDSGTVRALIDTDALDAREWAEATFESHRREVQPLAPEPIPG